MLILKWLDSICTRLYWQLAGTSKNFNSRKYENQYSRFSSNTSPKISFLEIIFRPSLVILLFPFSTTAWGFSIISNSHCLVWNKTCCLLRCHAFIYSHVYISLVPFWLINRMLQKSSIRGDSKPYHSKHVIIPSFLWGNNTNIPLIHWFYGPVTYIWKYCIGKPVSGIFKLMTVWRGKLCLFSNKLQNFVAIEQK